MKNLNDKPNKISNLNKANPFIVPENYFDGLTKQIEHKILEQPAHKIIYLHTRRLLAIAAVFIAVMMLGFMIKYYSGRKPYSNNELNMDELASLVETGNLDIDEYIVIKEAARTELVQNKKVGKIYDSLNKLNEDELDESSILDEL